MPLIRFDLLEGRSETELVAILDTAHQAVLDAFHVPPRDRYQIIYEHKKAGCGSKIQAWVFPGPTT